MVLGTRGSTDVMIPGAAARLASASTLAHAGFGAVQRTVDAGSTACVAFEPAPVTTGDGVVLGVENFGTPNARLAPVEMELVDAALRLGLLTAAMCVRVESATFAGPLSSSLYFFRVGLFTIIIITV